jgi:rare lipoprotein A
MPIRIKIRLFRATMHLSRWIFAIAFFSCVILSGCARDVGREKGLSQPPEHVPVPADTGVKPTLRPYRIHGVRYYPIPDSEGFVEFGDLSWYGGKFHGKATASGEIYDMYKQSAAHKTLPMGTWVRVINLSNDRETVVRINDRGPFVKGRILDLSYASARELGLLAQGVARGKIVALAPEVEKNPCVSSKTPILDVSSLHNGFFCVQVGAFSNRDSAVGLAERLKVLFEDVTVTKHSINTGELVHRVRVSRSQTLTEAEEIERRLTAMGFTDAFVVRL